MGIIFLAKLLIESLLTAMIILSSNRLANYGQVRKLVQKLMAMDESGHLLTKQCLSGVSGTFSSLEAN